MLGQKNRCRFPSDRFMGEEDATDLREDPDLCEMALDARRDERSTYGKVFLGGTPRRWVLVGVCCGFPLKPQNNGHFHISRWWWFQTARVALGGSDVLRGSIENPEADTTAP